MKNIKYIKNFPNTIEDKLIFKWKPTHNFLFSFYISIIIFILNVNSPLGFLNQLN